MLNWRGLILAAFGLAFGSDFVRAVFELVINFYYRRQHCKPVVLDHREAAIVIPCHNSETSIEATVRTLPKEYTIYCVANNCGDGTVEVVKSLHSENANVKLIDVEFPGRSKTQAVLLGVIQAARERFTHFLLLDDDVIWPSGYNIEVFDKFSPCTGISIFPQLPNSLIQGCQVWEYIGTNLNKRSQAVFARNNTWASGAAAIYRCDTFLEVMRFHDGEFAGEDVQCSYLHHYFGHKIDFLGHTIVTTEVPRGFSAWWRQRAHSWDVSFMFLHIELLLGVLFRPFGKGPGWWTKVSHFLSDLRCFFGHHKARSSFSGPASACHNAAVPRDYISYAYDAVSELSDFFHIAEKAVERRLLLAGGFCVPHLSRIPGYDLDQQTDGAAKDHPTKTSPETFSWNIHRYQLSGMHAGRIASVMTDCLASAIGALLFGSEAYGATLFNSFGNVTV